MALLDKGIPIGHSSRDKYDKCYYDDYLMESTGPLLYKLDPNQINNCSSCLSVFGTRSGHNGYGVSTTVDAHITAPAQQLVDVDSILSNRNVVAGRCKKSKVNDIDVNEFKLVHPTVCNSFLDPIATHLTNPAQNYRSMAINRFFNLPKPAQTNIFYNFAVNSQLEAKDNYKERIPRLRAYDASLPRELKGRNPPMRCVGSDACSL
jgi:hypothetical protein